MFIKFAMQLLDVLVEERKETAENYYVWKTNQKSKIKFVKAKCKTNSTKFNRYINI